MAPYAAAVDEEARYLPKAADALLAADFHAPHVPERYGGAGAAALATVIVNEEVARACVSSSLIPAVNKLGSLPVQISGSLGQPACQGRTFDLPRMGRPQPTAARRPF